MATTKEIKPGAGKTVLRTLRRSAGPIEPLLQELQVHQVELEMQNHELRESKAALEVVKARYFDLFEMAPVGYITVNEAGLILECNLTLTHMVGVVRGALIQKSFSHIVANEDQDSWYLLRKRACATHEQLGGEMRLVRSDGSLMCCLVSATQTKDELGGLSIRLAITDISEQKQVQSRLRQNAAALNAISQGVIITTPDFLITSANAPFLAITGYVEAETLGRNCNFLQGPDTDPRTVQAMRGALQRRVNFDGEVLNYRKDGSAFWNALTISPVFDECGALTHFVGVTRDITESVKARQALEAAHMDLQRTSNLLERTGTMAKVGGWEVDLPSMQLTWTQETFRIAGIESLTEPPLEDGINLFAPEARPTIAAAVQAAIDKGTPYDLELPLITASGVHKWVRTQGFADLRDGKAIRIYGTFQDITDRVAAQTAVRDGEAFVRSIVDTVPGMLAYWGHDLVCRFANGAYLSWFGRSSQDMVGTRMESLLGDALYQRNEPFIRGVLAGENQQFERELTMANGEVRYTLAQYIAHRKDGQVVGFLALTTDITDVKAAQHSLALSLEAQQSLLKEVHHRVKNNLQVITSLLRLESARSTVGETKSVLTGMQDRIRAMAQLHEALHHSGTMAFLDFGTYLGKLARQVVQTHSAPNGSVQLILDMGSVLVGMDQATAGGLLLNEIISNSIKHGFPDGRAGEIRVTLQPVDAGEVAGLRWSLSVSDTGVGLPADFEERRKTSLGLQLVGDLSRQLGAKLTIDSAPDKGAKFTAVFTAKEPAASVMPS
jgi:PAS domain S-box-containing protein